MEKRDQYTVVLEDLRSNFKAFGENLGFVREKVDYISERVGVVESKVVSIEGRVVNIEGRVGNIEKKIDSHTQMIGRIMEDVEEIKSGMREKVDRTEFVKLEKRLVVLETIVYGGKKNTLSRK